MVRWIPTPVQRQKTSIESVTLWLEKNLRPGVKKEEILTLIGDYVKSQVLEAMSTTTARNSSVEGNSNTGAAAVATGNAQIVSSEPKAKRKRIDGDNDLDGRHEVKKLRIQERLDFILDLEQLVPEDRTQLTSQALNFVKKTIMPI
jgi:hypothetical protein